MSRQVKFDKKVSGKDAMFDEPYWLSLCGLYRLAKMDCVRPWRLFRRMKAKSGWPWIGVGVGFDNKDLAVLAANKHANGIVVE